MNDINFNIILLEKIFITVLLKIISIHLFVENVHSVILVLVITAVLILFYLYLFYFEFSDR